jgi:fucose permease
MLDNYLKHTKLDMDNNSQKNYASALYTLITVFFFWGFLAASNGIFIPFCKTHFNLTQFESQLALLFCFMPQKLLKLIS